MQNESVLKNQHVSPSHTLSSLRIGFNPNRSSDTWSDCVSDDCMMIHPLKDSLFYHSKCWMNLLASTCGKRCLLWNPFPFPLVFLLSREWLHLRRSALRLSLQTFATVPANVCGIRRLSGRNGSLVAGYMQSKVQHLHFEPCPSAIFITLMTDSGFQVRCIC